jgi:hypothetical protein
VTGGLLGLVQEFRAALVQFEPGAYSAADCAVLVEELATAEKACAAARVRAAVRAGSCGAHQERGFAAASDWMARAAGTSVAAAKTALDMAAALDDLPGVRAALNAGELSLAQVRELVKTEAECPGSAAELLDLARSQSLKTLKEEARRRRLGALDPEQLHALQHEAKIFRHWRTGLGTVGFTGELPPEIGIPIMNRLDAETDRLWQQSRQAAKRAAGCGAAGPRRSAVAADALVRLVETGGKGKARSADLVIVCDLRAYRRGRAHEGEPCHIIGGGPIPVSLAHELGRDAFVKAVLHDGVKIDTIAHFGRKSSAVLRTALDLGAPPGFEGAVCSQPNCDRRYHLERDHIDPVANGGPTAFANIVPLCYPHHQIKTERDRRTGLLGRGGRDDPP